MWSCYGDPVGTQCLFDQTAMTSTSPLGAHESYPPMSGFADDCGKPCLEGLRLHVPFEASITRSLQEVFDGKTFMLPCSAEDLDPAIADASPDEGCSEGRRGEVGTHQVGVGPDVYEN